MRSIYSAVGLGALWIAAVGLVSPAAAQIPASGSEAWILPRMPDGRPDLQGNWTNATLTPFQRRRGQGPVLTREEVATLEGRAEARDLAGAQPSDPNRLPPRAGGSIGSYKPHLSRRSPSS